jgi:hypothetical protein
MMDYDVITHTIVKWAELQFLCLAHGDGLSGLSTSPATEHDQRDARSCQDKEGNGDDQRCSGGR